VFGTYVRQEDRLGSGRCSLAMIFSNSSSAALPARRVFQVTLCGRGGQGRSCARSGAGKLFNCALNDAAVTRCQVRISELKEILSYRGGFPSALQPQVGSQIKAESADDVATASKTAVADRQQLRSAISNLSLCIDRAGDDESPVSSPVTESAAGQGGSRVSTATHHIIRALALEDGSSCGPIPNLYNRIVVSF
jgi:hypothetical protein